ncbi:MAG: hypothetical protein QOD03_411 [Verrucomicrobiota bacterium]
MKTQFVPDLLKRVTFILTIWFFCSSQADPLDNWTSSQVSTNPFGFNGLWMTDVTSGNGRYVTVGQYTGDDNGVVQTSEDGMNWTMRSLHDYSILDLYGVTYGNGKFVAVGWDYFAGHNIYHSTNGINWTSHTTSIANLYAVTYGGGLFVAVGDGVLLNSSSKTTANIYISEDAITWSAVDSVALVADVHALRDVAYGGGNFVAVDGSGYFYISSDGYDWTRTANSRAGNRVSFCKDRFYVPAGAGTNLVSTNGLTWSLLTNNTASTFGRVVYVNGFFAALSGTNVFTSGDGTNWTKRILPTASNVTLTGIASGDRNLVAVGYTSPSLPLLPKAYVSDSYVALRITAESSPQLQISGLQNRSYRIDYLNDFQSSNWQSLTNFSLTNSPLLWTDVTATNSQRFYRAVLLP